MLKIKENYKDQEKDFQKVQKDNYAKINFNQFAKSYFIIIRL